MVFPKIYGGVDYGVPLPFPNSSFWLYAHAGMVGGHRAELARRLLFRLVPQQLRR